VEATLTDADWEIVHELRLRGFIENPDVERVTVIIESGFATLRTTKLVITPEGRNAHSHWARCEPGSETEDQVRRAFDRFLVLNSELLQLCSDWQVKRGGVANDHADAAYDWAVIDRLIALDERASAVTRHAGKAVSRLAPYRSRLRAARTRVEEGEHEWFTSPRIDSYHTVWMQWHEDLLLTLGLERDAHAR
jgi:pyruvate,orthophosphate dikinase